MLPQIKLNQTGIYLSRLGLGTVKFGRNQSVKYPESFDLPSDEQITNLLASAKDLGINFLDTAPAYGTSEERLGELLQKQRQDWVICTKAGEEFYPSQTDTQNEKATGRSQFNFSPKAIQSSAERSLRRLRTDYLDILLIHSDGNDMEVIERYEVLDTLSELKRLGWIRAFGISTKTVEGTRACFGYADLVLATYNPEDTEDQKLFADCAKADQAICLKKIFNNGQDFVAHATPRAKRGTFEQNRAKRDYLEQKMQTIFSQSAVKSAIIGTLEPAHLKMNVECALSVLNPN